ncbi:MAG TPA: glutamate-5-semialdehyde dehydrogenase [Solirubrobacterales bacterium]|jgi:glutamate-5-semialdehyde dehydrogenase|nr:glutamate-5-semialdehyde dehydrogenase [Solirubrobacterales bacterium]
MATGTRSVHDVCVAAKQAAHALARADRAAKDACLLDLADRIVAGAADLLEANAADVEAGREEGLNEALIDRLTLTEARIAEMAKGVREIAALDDPVGEVTEAWTLENGLDVRKQRAPLGVVAIVYEARPNVTVDAAALCLKSGNAAVLRGSSSAETSNGLLAGLISEALATAGLPEASVSLLAGGGHEQLGELAAQDGLVDLIIPRGGEGLKQALKAVATVPVMYAAAGNCHVYVHEDADLQMAQRIAYNAKVQRPGVCNAAETLLVHEAAAPALLPALLQQLADAGVALVGDERARANAGSLTVGPATPEDWDTEYHGLKMAVGVVDSLGEAIDHVNRHGTHHSDAIVTSSELVGEEFTDGVDSAAVYVNASTRFTDGYEFGMGAEIGNSTQKLHARGPIGLRELTTTKYVVRGSGQVRE